MKILNLLVKGNSTASEAPIFQIATAMDIEISISYVYNNSLYYDKYKIITSNNLFNYNISEEIQKDDIIVIKQRKNLNHPDIVGVYYGDDIINDSGRKMITVVYKCLGYESNVVAEIKYNSNLEHSINWCYPSTRYITANNSITFNNYNWDLLEKLTINNSTNNDEFDTFNPGTVLKLNKLSSRTEYNNLIFWYQDYSYAINNGYIKLSLADNKVYTPANIGTKIKFYIINDTIYIHIIVRCILKIFSCNGYDFVAKDFTDNEEIPQTLNLSVSDIPTESGLSNGEYKMLEYNNTKTPIFKKYGNTWITADGFNPLLIRRGESYNRPTPDDTQRGFQYYDYTLNKPIWWTGTKWVDATGAEV